MPNKKYFSYVRVSTQRQGQIGTSLDEQQAAIEQFAHNYNLTIAKRFEERETAAKQGRPVFLDMLKQLKGHMANGVIIHKIDRSARNLKDWADLGALIDTGLEVHFASESLDLSSRGGRLSADIQAVVASDFIRNLREETKKGIYGRLKQGLFPFRAPIGYLDGGKGKPKEIDPVIGPLIRKAFELYATGDWSLLTLPDEMYELGLRSKSGAKLTVNGMATVLHNSFYMGVITIKKTGSIYAGIHRPIITKRLFDQVQDVCAGRNVSRQTVHNFTFRRLIRCGKCRNLLIGEVQKHKVYYRCHTRACTSACLKEETVSDELCMRLKKLEINPEESRMFRDESIQLFGDWKDESDKARDELIHRNNQIKDRQARLVDSYMDGIIDKEAYFERKAQLMIDEQKLQSQLTSFGNNWEDVPSKFEEFLELANSAYLSFKSAPVDLKREMLEIVTSNIIANGKSVSVKLENGFELLAARPTFTSGSPKGVDVRTIQPFLSQLFKFFVENASNEQLKSSPLSDLVQLRNLNPKKLRIRNETFPKTSCRIFLSRYD